MAMSDLCARNLLPNPKPTGTRGWSRFGDVEVRMTNDGTGIFCRNISGGGARGIDYALPDLPAGEWVYGFVMASSTYVADETIALIKTGPTTYGSMIRFAETSGEHAYTGEFTSTAPGVNWLFTPPKTKDGAMSVKRFLLVTREDWETMQKNDVRWFDGDGFLTGGGFTLAACIHMWIAALLWWWSHEQHRTSKYVHAAVPREQAQCVECGERAARRWPVAVQGRWQLRAWHGACGDQIDRSGCGRCTRVGLRVRQPDAARWLELGLGVLHAWLRLAARRHSVRPDWLECVQDRGHVTSQPRVHHPPRRRLGHNPRLRELHGRGLADYRSSARHGQLTDRMVRTTTRRYQRPNLPAGSHTLTTSRLGVAA